MCVIISKNQNIEVPSMSMLEDAWDSNPDGAGVLFRRRTDKRFTICKGFLTFASLRSFLEETNFSKSDFVAYHFRITTSGETNAANCHPFPVSSRNSDLKELYFQTEKAILHNGILFSTNGDYSDTQVFTKYLSLRNLVDLTDRPKINAVKKLAKGNRLLIADGNNIVYTGDWINDDGLMLSNDHFKYKVYYGSFISELMDDDNKAIKVEQMIDDVLYDNNIWIEWHYVEEFLASISTVIETMALYKIEDLFHDYLESIADKIYKETVVS